MDWTIGIKLYLKLHQNCFPLHSLPVGLGPLCLCSVHAVLRHINLAYQCVFVILILVL